MRPLASALICSVLALAAAGCATEPASAPRAPQPAKAVDQARLYSGVWHEVARTPMRQTVGCVAGIIAFSTDAKGRIIDRDSCRMGAPDAGREKVFTGPVEILPGSNNTKFTTRFGVVGPLGPRRTYWILDHDDAYAWFIAATPDLQTLSIYTRDPHFALLDRGLLVDRAKALGYNGLLEYPAQPTR